MLNLIYSPEAIADLEELFSFIANDNPQRAKTYIDQILDACKTLCASPNIGVSREDIYPSLRIFPLWKKVIIAYKVTSTCVEILRVFSGGQDYITIMQND